MLLSVRFDVERCPQARAGSRRRGWENFLLLQCRCCCVPPSRFAIRAGRHSREANQLRFDKGCVGFPKSASPHMRPSPRERLVSKSPSERTLVTCQCPACQRCDRHGRLLEGVPVGTRVFVAVVCVQMSLLGTLTAKAIVGSKHRTCYSIAGVGDGASGKTGATKRGLKPVCGNRDLYNVSGRDPQFVVTGGRVKL